MSSRGFAPFWPSPPLFRPVCAPTPFRSPLLSLSLSLSLSLLAPCFLYTAETCMAENVHPPSALSPIAISHPPFSILHLPLAPSPSPILPPGPCSPWLRLSFEPAERPCRSPQRTQRRPSPSTSNPHNHTSTHPQPAPILFAFSPTRIDRVDAGERGQNLWDHVFVPQQAVNLFPRRPFSIVKLDIRPIWGILSSRWPLSAGSAPGNAQLQERIRKDTDLPQPSARLGCLSCERRATSLQQVWIRVLSAWSGGLDLIGPDLT